MSGGPVTLSFASLLAEDIVGLAAFYRDVFDLPEVSELDSPHFRGLWVGDTVLGFSAPSAYELLKLQRPAGGRDGDRSFLTFECADDEDVQRRTDAAIGLGATAVQAPHRTYYGAWQAVVRDPEHNPFRINHLALVRT